MIEKVFKSMGKKRCPECRKLLDEERKACTKCGHSFVNTSTPEDGLND